MRSAVQRNGGGFTQEQTENIAAAGVAEYRRRESVVREPLDIGVYGDRLFSSYFPNGTGRVPNFLSYVRLEVVDRGPGIARARQYGVFEAFGELGPESASQIGSGVGLSVVKLLAEAQGGRAGFSSAPFVETRFWVELPAHPLSGEGNDVEDDDRFDLRNIFPDN